MTTELTWDDITSLVRKLADQIKADYDPELVIAIGEGGWIPARLLKNYFRVPFFSLRCKNYDDDNNKLGNPFISQNLEGVKIEGLRVLVVDEVSDSGETTDFVYRYIRSLKPAQLKTAVLHRKAQSIFKPEFVAEEVDNDWIVYPWEKESRFAGM